MEVETHQTRKMVIKKKMCLLINAGAVPAQEAEGVKTEKT